MVSGYLQDSCGLPGKYSGVSDSVVNDGSKRVDHRVTLQQNTYSWPNIFFCFFFLRCFGGPLADFNEYFYQS